MITQFVEFVVFDTIRIRKREWPVAFELMVVLMRKVEIRQVSSILATLSRKFTSILQWKKLPRRPSTTMQFFCFFPFVVY